MSHWRTTAAADVFSLSVLSPKCEGPRSFPFGGNLSGYLPLVGIDRQTRILRTYGRNTELLLYRHSVRAFHTRPPSTLPAVRRPDGS